MNISVDRDTQIALGKTLRALDEADGDLDGKIEGKTIVKVKVDGTSVDAAAALAAFDTFHAAPEKPGWAAIDYLAAQVEKCENKLEKWKVWESRVGESLKKAIYADPEHVAREAKLEITLDDGARLKLPLDVVDLQATHFLQQASMGTEVVSLLPVVGPVFLGAASLAAISASLMLKDKKPELATALAKTSTKHLILAAAGMVVMVGAAAAGIAVSTDRNQRRALKNPYADASAIANLVVKKEAV